MQTHVALHSTRTVSATSRLVGYTRRYSQKLASVSLPVVIINFQVSLLTTSLGMGNFKFIGKEHHDLNKKPFMMMDYSTVRGTRQHFSTLGPRCKLTKDII